MYPDYSSFVKTISPVLSNAAFQKIIKGDNIGYIQRKASKYVEFGNLNLSTYSDFYEYLYTDMLKNYRSEFIYKNEIVNKILLGRYSLNTAAILNEFRIGKSIADLVLLNGTSIVYEIKTEYDSPERLLSQIIDYRKSFLNVVVVTHHSVKEKYLNFLNANRLENIGLLVLTNRNTLSSEIMPKEDTEYLDVHYMFNCLRKSEYISLIRDYFEYTPDVPDTKIYRECLRLAKKIDELDFHNLMFDYLKKRTIKEKNMVSSQMVPPYLKHISICSDFKRKDMARLNTFLNKNL